MLLRLKKLTEKSVTQKVAAVNTLGDVRDLLSKLPGSEAQETKLQISAINTVARASGCAPEDLPADPARLREHLNAMSPAMAGLTRGSWSSVRSRILKALKRTKVAVMPARRTKPLSEEWAALYQQLPHRGHQAGLGRFIGYLSDHGVRPHEVCDGHLERFRDELEASSLRGRPSGIVGGAIRVWNIAVDTVPGWPQQRLTTASVERGSGYVLSLEDFPPGFQQSLRDYISFLTDPPDDDIEAPPKGLRPNTLKLREFQFRQMASALVHRGIPIETITSIDVLATRESVNAICDFFMDRSTSRFSPQLDGLLSILRPIAAYRLKQRDLADWIRLRRRRLSGGRSRRFGMTEKNRRRLAVFRDRQQVRDLLLLPFKLLKRAESGTMHAKDAARLVRAAVAIELELMCPIRLQNLSELNADTDFVRSNSKKHASVHLFIPADRTKNGEDIELELPQPTIDLISLYLAKYRNELIHPGYRGKGPRYLFPKHDGTPKMGRVFADGICRVLDRELGIKFNIHLFRHLGCYLYLRSHPGQIDVMRRVLGHRDGTTTMRFYAFIEQSEAFRMFDEHVLQIRQEILRPSRRTKPPRQRISQ